MIDGRESSGSTRTIHVPDIVEPLSRAIRAAAYSLPEDYLAALNRASHEETDEGGRRIINILIENAAVAEREELPTCQDTGMAIFWVSLPQDARLVGGNLRDALNEAVRCAYKPLRKSIVGDPLRRANTGDNTPAIVHFDLRPGSVLQIEGLLKGFGGEGASRSTVLPPAAGLDGALRFVLETVRAAGANACPPFIVGVGLGGSMDYAPQLAKHALLRRIGSPNPDAFYGELESRWLREVNRTGVGPQGLGGGTTALALHIEPYATHIASLPVAVNLNCSAPRRFALSL